MKSKPFIPSMLFTLSILYAFAIPHTFAIEPAIETAVLKGNWEALVNMLEKDDSKANDPVSRLIMAHAGLATNRNNAAMMLFLSIGEEGDVTSWSDWTSSLLNKNPENPVALYLHADAQARSGNHSEAVQLLTKAVNLPSSPLSQNSLAGEIDNTEMVNYALVCNGRGVLRMLTDDMDYALMDFLQATRLAPSLADAHANLGSYYIMTEAADGALEEFNNAIEINPEFALAYNGLGCAYFGNGKFEEASQSFSMASQLCPTLAIAEINQGFTSAYSSKLITVAEKITENPGTTFTSISKQYPEIVKEQNQQLLKTLPSQSDHEFWGKINNVSSLSDSQYQSLVKEYGAQKVQMGAFLKMQELKGTLAENYQTKLSIPEKTNFANSVLPSALSSSEFTGGSQKSWKSFFTPPSNVSSKETVLGNMLKQYSNTSTAGKQVIFNITDFGIGQWKPELKTGDDFAEKKGVFSEIPRSGQVLIVMPSDRDFQKMNDVELTRSIYDAIKARVDGGLAVGTRAFELQLIQHIGKPGYFDPSRQDAVNRFGKCAYEAIGMLNNHLKQTNLTPYNYFVGGSNGTKVFTENVQAWKPYMHKADLFDGRAFKTPTIEAIVALRPENVRMFNTLGDFPAENVPIAHSIGNHDVVKDLKKQFPALTSVLLDPRDRPNIVGFGHLAGMDQNSKIVAKYLNTDGISYTTSREMTGRDLLPKPIVEKQGGIKSNFVNSANLLLIGEKLNRISGISASSSLKQSSSPIPGYFTATDRPITEIGALASMVDKGIKSSGSTRSALIVSQDTFRTKLLQSELSKYGFQTKVIPPGTDPQAAARQWGADVILGVKGTPEMKFPQKTSMPLGNSLQKYPGNDNYRKVQPLLPPDNGGGGGGIVNQNWNWGKQFTPTYSKGLPPGGVSTEEIAKAFVDKGNWPVLTTFSLFYK
ncbi:MAG: tetratricopeptide repeat protein [Candidatus Brocadiaceae bacterium]|nr:tetratricopeptide repeat protein [Candidatus Brocadiaceae bacterium]